MSNIRRVFRFAILVSCALCLSCGSEPPPEIAPAPEIEAGPPGVTGVLSGVTPLVSQASNSIAPSISPDGNWVAFSQDSEPSDSEEYNWDIFVVSTQVGEIIKVTGQEREKWQEQNPTWMPDSKLVVYNSTFPNQLNLWMKPFDSASGAMKLTTFGGFTQGAMWASASPDGQKIAYAAGAYDPESYDILSSFAVTPEDLSADPDGWYLQGANHPPQIWILDLKSRLPTLLTEGIQPSFCPDGKRLAFVKMSTAKKLEIWTINLDGTRPALVASTGGHDMEPCWSPSGRGLVWVAGSSGSWKIWAIQGEQTYPMQLTTGPSQEGHPSWGVGGILVFHSDSGSNTYKIWKAKIKF